MFTPKAVRWIKKRSTRPRKVVTPRCISGFSDIGCPVKITDSAVLPPSLDVQCKDTQQIMVIHPQKTRRYKPQNSPPNSNPAYYLNLFKKKKKKYIIDFCKYNANVIGDDIGNKNYIVKKQ